MYILVFPGNDYFLLEPIWDVVKWSSYIISTGEKYFRNVILDEFNFWCFTPLSVVPCRTHNGQSIIEKAGVLSETTFNWDGLANGDEAGVVI